MLCEAAAATSRVLSTNKTEARFVIDCSGKVSNINNYERYSQNKFEFVMICNLQSK